MPLAISPDGKGWVKVPPPRRRKITPADRTEAFKSPLAYFACTPVPAPKPRIPNIPVYHLDPNEHTPPGSAASGGPRKKMKGKGRSVSSPHGVGAGGHRHPYDEEYGYNDEEEAYEVHVSPAARAARRAGPQSTISHERVRPRHTPGAVAAAVSAVGGSSPPKPRAVTAAPSGGGYQYWTGPSNKTRAPAPPRSVGTNTSGGNVSARWANATAPLAL